MNNLTYIWKWVYYYTPTCTQYKILSSANLPFTSEEDCLTNAYANVPFIAIRKPADRMNLILVTYNRSKAEESEKLVFTLY